ncbi:MAG: DUF2007 domain-containing protein [Candidatus Latescibacterota bacterium]|jgi:hypothetical protein
MANEKLIAVSMVNNPALLTLAKSILEDANIPYITRGEGFQVIYATGPVTLLVNEQDAEQARELLADL